MENKTQKPDAKGMILSICPVCQGTGKVPKKLPFLANPKAPATRPDKLGTEPCPRCEGHGRIGIE